MFKQLVAQLIYIFSVCGVIVLSISGALYTGKKGMDIGEEVILNLIRAQHKRKCSKKPDI
jgi:uncharacterized membrane protein YeiH